MSEFHEKEFISYFHPSIWFKLKMFFFGNKHVERAGRYTMVVYEYKGKLYLTRYDAL